MVGKDCVAIACDLRLGLQALTVSNDHAKLFRYGESLYVGLTGLATDVASVSELLRYKVNLYRLREERGIAPKTLANLVATSLYERRFGPWFVSPVLAGLDPTTGKPFICGFDSLGCIDFAKDFIVSGTASDQLFGTCEGLWEPDLVSRLATYVRAQGRAANGLGSTRGRTIFSRRCRKPCSTLWIGTPCRAGGRTSTLSRRTRLQSGC